MNKETYSTQLAIEIPGKGYAPMPNEIVASYNLSPGMRSPFTGYKVVPRKSEWELKRCSDCNTDLLFNPTDSTCPVCGAVFRSGFSCAKCHTIDDIGYKSCNHCGFTICIFCLAGTNGIPRALPFACPQCGSEEFQLIEQLSSAPSP